MLLERLNFVLAKVSYTITLTPLSDSRDTFPSSMSDV